MCCAHRVADGHGRVRLRLVRVAALLLIAAGVAGWWQLQMPDIAPASPAPDAAMLIPRDEPVPPAPAPTPRERARFDRAAYEADKMAGIQARFAASDTQPPFPERVAAALRRAESGDVDAAAELGNLLAGCTSTLLDPEARKITADWQRELAHVEDLRRTDPENAEMVLRNRRRSHERVSAIHADCIAVGLPLLADYHVWLERGARGGSVDAMRGYALNAFSDFADQNAMLADVDEVLRRRDLARAFLRQAFERGDVMSIEVLAGSHDWEAWTGQRVFVDQGGLLAPDPMMAQTYWYLDALARSAHFGQGEPFEQLWVDGPEQQDVVGLNEAQWQAVANAARALYLRHFTDPPPPPG